jgi:TIR domain
MIAIPYRREDSTSIAGRLHDRLRAEFGKENVFMDFDSIPYGVDFRDHIAQTLEAAEVLVAVIGPGWLGQRVSESTRRIDDTTDFVRLEIAGALQRGIPVIPVLVDKTPMPMEDTLPNDLKPLVFRNALMLDTGIDFHHHADRLIKGIRSLLKRQTAGGRFKWLGMFDRLRYPAPSRQDHEGAAESTSQTSAGPVTTDPNEISAQSGGTEAGASDALPETTQLTERDLDFERYGGGTNERSQKESALFAGSAPEFASPVTAPAVSVTESSSAPSPPPVTVAQDLGALKESHNSFFSAKLLGLIFAGAFIGFVAYFVVTSKTKSTSGGTEKVVQPSVPVSQASPSIVPESSPVPSTTVVTDSSHSASKISPAEESTPSNVPSEETASSTSSDQTSVPSHSPEIATTPPALEQAPLAKNGRTWQAWIGDFVRQFVAANQLKDANATLALYAPTVDYFDDHHADQAFIRRDIEKYNERWPVRQDSIEGDINLQEKVPDQEYVASFKLNFYAESAPRAIWTKGQFKIDLDITIVDAIPKISGIKEKMLHQQKGKPNSAKPNASAATNRAQYPQGIRLPGNPGFVKSPYAPSKGLLDIRRYHSGTQVKCPFTGKIFVVP